MSVNWNNSLTARAQWLVIALLAGALLGGCAEQKGADEAAGTSAATDVYTCPMHPEIIRNEPGKCPVCGMHLVKKAGSPPASPASASTRATGPNDSARVPSPNEQVLSRVRLIRPVRAAEAAAITAPGAITYDPRRIENIAARFAGRIERLYVSYSFQPVRRGQKLYDIYSPELVTEQQNLLFLLQTNDPDDHALLQASRQKLRLLGLSAAQVRAVEQRRRPQLSISVYSPVSGYVMEPAAQPNSSGAASSMIAAPMPGPSSTGAALEQTAPLAIREGQYVERGQRVFQVVNTDQVWARLQVYAADVAAVQRGQPVEITLNDQPDAPPRRATIALLEPVLAGDAATVTARVYLPNPGGQLKIGQLVTARISLPAAAGLWVPATAVVELGTRQVVFRQQARSSRLLAVPVVTGARSGTQVQVVQGLNANDQITENAQYLVDSESFIKPVAHAQQ
ncbi:efflux RND transporter periplasmic adaptor subunit [Hymenobacter sp. B1770]|uniref:efflux RND transporter periplasmic adaptor subunit n=1 Tax=Hymenobacter sp. B1770 TaxID=1718788 RepID=UPI003CE9B955